jgi:8-oxo-dGTP diphosphatase
MFQAFSSGSPIMLKLPLLASSAMRQGRANSVVSNDQAISVSTKAAVVDGDRVLLVAYDDGSFHYNLPGGKVRTGEALREAAVRKVSEETTAEVQIGSLLYVVEYVPRRWDGEFGDVQKVQFNFLARLRPGSVPELPPVPDPYVIGLEWVAIDDLPSVPLLPRVGDRLCKLLRLTLPYDPLFDVW